MRKLQLDWTPQERRGCMHIINNSGMRVIDSASEIGSTVRFIQHCFELLGMKLDEKKDGYIGAPKQTMGDKKKGRSIKAASFTSMLKSWAKERGMTFKYIGNKNYAMFARESEVQMTQSYHLGTWADLFENELIEGLIK